MLAGETEYACMAVNRIRLQAEILCTVFSQQQRAQRRTRGYRANPLKPCASVLRVKIIGYSAHTYIWA